jgi:hypothetical protein
VERADVGRHFAVIHYANHVVSPEDLAKAVMTALAEDKELQYQLRFLFPDRPLVVSAVGRLVTL